MSWLTVMVFYLHPDGATDGQYSDRLVGAINTSRIRPGHILRFASDLKLARSLTT